MAAIMSKRGLILFCCSLRVSVSRLLPIALLQDTKVAAASERDFGGKCEIGEPSFMEKTTENTFRHQVGSTKDPSHDCPLHVHLGISTYLTDTCDIIYKHC
jgi:hypothetical protein